MQEIVSLAGMTIEGRYEVLEALGEERGSIVYSARQVATDRPVRLRVLPRALLGDPVILDRCNRAVRAASSLRHPNTLQTYAYGRLGDGEFYVVTEDVRGVTLRALLDAGVALPVERAAHIAAEVCSSLTEAHAIGVVHGSLTPASIVVEQTPDGFDRVRVSDYGLGRFLLPETRMPGPEGKGIDRKDYESPEESEGHRAPDARSDLYTVGVLFYEMIAGQRASSKDAVVSSLWEITPDHEVPVTIDALFARTLSRAPEGRLPSAGVFRERLEEAVALLRRDTRTVRLRKLSEYRRLSEAGPGARENGSGPLPVVARPAASGRAASTIPPVRLRRDRLRRFAVIGGAAALAVALVVTLLLLLHPWQSGGQTEEPHPAPVAVTPGSAGTDTPVAPVAAAGRADAGSTDGGPRGARSPGAAPTPCSRVTITSTPPNATITRGGNVVGRTPLEACIPADDSAWELVLSAPDHAPAPVRIDPSVGGRIEVRLAPLPAGARAAMQGPPGAPPAPDETAMGTAPPEPELEIVDPAMEKQKQEPVPEPPGPSVETPPEPEPPQPEPTVEPPQPEPKVEPPQPEPKVEPPPDEPKAERPRREPKAERPKREREPKAEEPKTEPKAEEPKPKPEPRKPEPEKQPEPKPVRKVDLPEPDF